MFSGIPGLYLSYASSTSLVMIFKNIARHYQTSTGCGGVGVGEGAGPNSPQLKTTALDPLDSSCSSLFAFPQLSTNKKKQTLGI